MSPPTFPPGSIRVLADGMLGALARRLRLLGVDTGFLADADDALLAWRALSEGRILLTRDRALARRMGGKGFLVEGKTLDEELGSVAPLLRGHPGAVRPFTRCLVCNGPLEDLPAGEARSLVPPRVWLNQKIFFRCSSCGRAYWKGSHSAGMERTVAAMRKDMGL